LVGSLIFWPPGKGREDGGVSLGAAFKENLHPRAVRQKNGPYTQENSGIAAVATIQAYANSLDASRRWPNFPGTDTGKPVNREPKNQEKIER
jgi:hypothetical protein